MVADLHDVATLLKRARQACVDMAVVHDQIFLTMAEARRLRTNVPSGVAPIAPSHTIAASATPDYVKPIDLDGREREHLAVQLEAIQATARAIAHALNQPLAVILCATELIQTAPPDEPPASDLAQIVAAVDRAAAIIRDLLRVARYTTQMAADGKPMLDLRTAIDPPVVLE